jgi:hypothetical protein
MSNTRVILLALATIVGGTVIGKKVKSVGKIPGLSPTG